MRRRVGRRLLTAAFAGGLLAAGAAIGGTTSPALATPTAKVQGQPADAESVETRAQQLPPQAKEAVQRDLDMSPEEYIETADAAREAAATSRKLRDAVGKAYAGSWFDPASKKLNVAVTDDGAADKVRAAGGDAHVREVSHEALAGARDAIQRWADSLAPEQRKLFHATITDVRAGKVVVKLGDSAAAKDLASAVPQTGAPVAIEHEAGDGLVTHVRGGEGIALGPTDDPADLAGLCSLGFNAVDSDGLGRPLTAGHCALGGQQYVFTEEGLTEIGTFETHVFGEGGDDYATVRVTNPAMRLTPDVNNYNGGAVQVLGAVAPIVGMPICKSGRTTAWTCGEVLDAEEPITSTPPVGDPVDLVTFVHNACSEPGDSGGAVLAGNDAVGLTQGGRPAVEDPMRCPSAFGGENFSVAEILVSDVLSDFGDDLHLLTADGDADGDGVADVEELNENPTAKRDANGDGVAAFLDPDEPKLRTPVITQPANAGRTSETTPAIMGTGKAGATVGVRVDDGAVLNTTVQPDGNWGVTPEALAIGEHELSVTQTFGDIASDPATSTFTVVPVAPVITSPGDGTVADDNRPTFTGTGIAGATLHLTSGDQAIDVTVGDDGNWSAQFGAEFPVGKNTVNAVQEVDSVQSDPASVVYEVRDPNPQPGPNPPGDDDGDGLADTGVSSILTLTVGGLVLLLVGAGVLFLVRRRTGTVRP